MTSSTFTLLCDHHLYLVLKHFRHSPRNTHNQAVIPHSSFNPALGTMDLLSVFGFTYS